MTDEIMQPKRPIGFAKLSPEKRKEMASIGGKALMAKNRAFSKDPELARSAGSLGGTQKAAGNSANKESNDVD